MDPINSVTNQLAKLLAVQVNFEPHEPGEINFLIFSFLGKKRSKRTTNKIMNIAIKPQSPFLFKSTIFTINYRIKTPITISAGRRRKLAVKSTSDGGGENNSERRSFLTLEEAGLVEISGLSTHERFLCRLTVQFLRPNYQFKKTLFFKLEIDGRLGVIRYRHWTCWEWYRSRKGVGLRSWMRGKYAIGSSRISSRENRIWTPPFSDGTIPISSCN